MSGQTDPKREGRVKRLKGIIIGLLFALLILPLICSLVMLFRIRDLNHRLEEMTVTVDKLKSGMENSGRGDEPAADAPLTDEDENLPGEEAVTSQEQTADTPVPGGDPCKVYLTFDDGPSSNTGAILDLLKQYGVKASFFVTGKEGEEYEALYRRIVDEGHTLGMHSYSHKYGEIYADKQAFITDLEKLQDYLYVTTGTWSRFYRFPGGSSNRVSKIDMQELADYLREQDIYYLDWNIACGDATGGAHSAKALSDRVLRYIGAEKTEVVLMHDAADKSTTVEALAIILEQLKDRDDVEILPVSEDMDFEAAVHLKSRGE
ncbi:MAG: polysaccharide deacetylase [Lachnospiraceae bacterium]|nr:polysaccharide deacetylase [Lachnospiraceae bacterium]